MSEELAVGDGVADPERVSVSVPLGVWDWLGDRVPDGDIVGDRDWVDEGVSVWLGERVPEGDAVGLRVGVSEDV